MNVKIPEALWLREKEQLRLYGVTDRSFKWQKWATLDISGLAPTRLKRLLALVEPYTRFRGVGMLAKDIRAWMKASSGQKHVIPRSVEQFAALVTELIRSGPSSHWLFHKETERPWLAYYVSKIEYYPEQEGRDYRTPPRTKLHLIWEEFGRREEREVTFTGEHCLDIPPAEALSRMGYYLETPELREGYVRDMERYEPLYQDVGKQMWGVGMGTTDLDGNGTASEKRRYHITEQIRLDYNGDPTRLVIDVFRESDTEDRNYHSPTVSTYFWRRAREVDVVGDTEAAVFEEDSNEPRPLEDEDGDPLSEMTASDRKELPEEEVETRPEFTIPTHPLLAMFDMKRHLRLKVHVHCLTDYEYDTKLSDKLILPEDVRSLIEMLITTKGVFQDIVKGKGGGAVILCAGPPGCGKTLSSEVYAESMQRPLYSVQCSQLGTSPTELEGELMRAFTRAQRWNAIMLLDEADVYVAARGSDLQQNAIVGVFLRVLEYYAGVMFLTTNRSELVDDAIASRCVARIDYTIPDKGKQRRIWEVLSASAGIKISAEVLDEVVRRYNLSGRDVKNLLKLARMVSESRGVPISADIIDFVKRFKPTVDVPAGEHS
jgi:hypothetical protein